MNDGTTVLYSNADGVAVDVPAANTDIIDDITIPQNGVGMITVWIQSTVASVFNVMRTRGGVEVALGLNKNSALTAGAMEAYDVEVNPGDVINLQAETWATGMALSSVKIEGVFSGVR